jgi:hypothetical protein
MFKRFFQRDSVDFDTGTIEALRGLSITVISVVVIIALSYGLPVLKPVRPWVPGEAIPLARLFTNYDRSLLPSFAEAGAAVTIDSPAAPPPTDISASKREKEHTGPMSRPQIDPEEIQGLTQPIDDPQGHALEPFYEALLRTAEKQPKAITRIAHFGDSAVAADSITVTMRRLMQKRFGDAGHGFILVAPGDMHYFHMDIYHRASNDWELFPIVLMPLGTDWYGYGGVQYRSGPDSWARFATIERGEIGRRVSRFEIFYQRYPGGGKLLPKLDDEKQAVVDTKSKQQEDAWYTVETTDGPHTLSIRTDGHNPVRMYGVTLERDQPGVVYDSLGMVGGRAERLLAFEHEHIQRQLKHRSPNLVILAFGGNEADNRWMNTERYESSLRKVLDHVRVPGSNVACLLFAPLDQGERDARGEIRTIPTVPDIVEAQRRAARAEGCAFFNTYAAMGGRDSMGNWYRQRPRLATSDFRHATPAGYEQIGNMFYKALLKGFDDYLKRASSNTKSKPESTIGPVHP